VYVKPSSHRITDAIIGQDDAELVKSVLTGLSDDGVFRNVHVSISNRLQTVSQPYTYAVSEGDLLNHYGILKFGTRTSVAAGVTSVIWEGTAALYTYLTTASAMRVVSSSAQDGAGGTGLLTLRLIGLDANFAEIEEDITLNGVTPVISTKSFIRIFRAYGKTSKK